MLNVWYKSALIIFGFVVVLMVNLKFNLKDDNPVEEAVEDFIGMQTKIDIDLTPISEEEK